MGLPQLKTHITEQQYLDDITFESIGLKRPALDIYKRVDNEETREFFNLKSDANPLSQGVNLPTI